MTNRDEPATAPRWPSSEIQQYRQRFAGQTRCSDCWVDVPASFTDEAFAHDRTHHLHCRVRLIAERDAARTSLAASEQRASRLAEAGNLLAAVSDHWERCGWAKHKLGQCGLPWPYEAVAAWRALVPEAREEGQG